MSERREQHDRIYDQVDDLEVSTKDLAEDRGGRVGKVQASIVDNLNEIRHEMGTIGEATSAKPAKKPD